MGPIWGSGEEKNQTPDLLSIPQFAFFMEAGPHTHGVSYKCGFSLFLKKSILTEILLIVVDTTRPGRTFQR